MCKLIITISFLCSFSLIISQTLLGNPACPPTTPTRDLEIIGYYIGAKGITRGSTYEQVIGYACTWYSQLANEYLNNTGCAILQGGVARAFLD
jgi:hypothetical protein